MNAASINPFPHDADRREIWDVLMRRDFDAFLAVDWSLTAPDFLPDEFHGIDGRKLPNPDRWNLRYPDLASYQAEWERQAGEFQRIELRGIAKRDFLFEAVSLREIEINGARAVAHKKFAGRAMTLDGAAIELLWQTLYYLRRAEGRWKITGFTGYLPASMPDGPASAATHAPQ